MKFDASALIYMVKASLTDVFLQYKTPIRITRTAFDEVVKKGKEKGFSDAFVIEDLVANKKIEVVPDVKSVIPILSNLGRGEQSSIAEAHQQKELLIIDDKKA